MEVDNNNDNDPQIELKENPGPSTTSSSSSTTTTAAAADNGSNPICVILLGMAGSGKTSLCGKLIEKLLIDSIKSSSSSTTTTTPPQQQNQPIKEEEESSTTANQNQSNQPYVINLDPACLQLNYQCNIDIRDSIHYKNVMKKYQLGPNGSIITALNLFVTRFDQVLQLIDKRKQNYNYVLFDTPGQVEVFTWSASGSIITESLASKYPTVILFIIDSIRSHSNPTTFMSNMLYACSIYYKYKLPLIIVLNKNDLIDHQFALDWIKNSELFEMEIEKDQSYMACLNQSLINALDIFYQDLPIVGVSSKTGQGFDELLKAINNCAKDYEENYREELEKINKNKKDDSINVLEEKTEQMSINDLNDDVQSKPKEENDFITFGRRTTNMDQ